MPTPPALLPTPKGLLPTPKKKGLLPTPAPSVDMELETETVEVYDGSDFGEYSYEDDAREQEAYKSQLYFTDIAEAPNENMSDVVAYIAQFLRTPIDIEEDIFSCCRVDLEDSFNTLGKVRATKFIYCGMFINFSAVSF